jgi:hypothetical protein
VSSWYFKVPPAAALVESLHDCQITRGRMLIRHTGYCLTKARGLIGLMSAALCAHGHDDYRCCLLGGERSVAPSDTRWHIKHHVENRAGNRASGLPETRARHCKPSRK